jgi:catechol 2,3-dioxygenase-like lactoylglutathione lyase family enzyme
MAIEVRGLAPLMEVWDMPASLAFYRDKLGFKVTGDSGQGDASGWVMLELGGSTIMLNTAYDDGERPEKEDPARVAAHHDTCIYFGCPDVDAAYQHLLDKNIQCSPPSVAPYGMKQLYVTDPDNYNLCFQWPADPS